ncbi:MAG: 2-C-methyl-D-erythritol 4-phosphate cytidylyltransferase [Kineosporiaceae bacterium]
MTGPAAVAGQAVVVVPVPAGGRDWLVSVSDHGEPAVVHAVAEAASLGARTVVVCDRESVTGLRAVLREADLAAVEVMARPPGVADLAQVSGVPADATVVLHDPLCPLTPRTFLAKALVEAMATPGEAVVAVRPMTDTVKVVREGRVTETVDRAGLRVLASPVVLPPGVAARLPETGDVPALVAALRADSPVRLLPAPPLARRVADRTGLDIALALRDLEAADR